MRSGSIWELTLASRPDDAWRASIRKDLIRRSIHQCCRAEVADCDVRSPLAIGFRQFSHFDSSSKLMNPHASAHFPELAIKNSMKALPVVGLPKVCPVDFNYWR